MIYRNIHLNPESYDFVRSRVENGRYANANELVQAALRALHREEEASEKNQQSSASAEEDVFRRLWEISADATQFRR